ncbi:putative cytochrome P450 313a4 [Lucilia cuprina]|uniref:Putative cytochrome P450 313a4 n=1 Tax=Lucilia cuprina TaxID=7375 RepID=A0A0L0BNQ1_LUCCU|nr:putative cytochrome P450 313a4 [Lucilia cuprina]
MELIFFGFAVCIVFVWLINRWYSRAFVSLAYKVPSNRWHTFLGWGKILRGKDILKNMYEHGKKYGPNCVYWMGPLPFFISTDPQILKEILTSKNCIDKPLILYKGFTSVAGQGIITENEPIWTQHRKLLNKAFSHKMLMSFIQIFHKESNGHIKQIQSCLENKEDIDLLVIFRELTIKIATKTLLQRNLEQTEFNSVIMSKHLHGILQYIADICFTPVMNIPWIRKIADNIIYKSAKDGLDMFKKLVAESLYIKQYNTTDPSYLPKVNSILEHVLRGTKQNLLKYNEIEGQIMHIFAGATETTSSTLFFAISLLAMHEEYQSRAFEEIINILPEDDNVVLTLEQLDQLVYLEMILNETMRLLPVVPMVFRMVKNDKLTLSNGLTLAVGQRICIDIFRLHRSKELWGLKADLFNPDNFLPENIAARHPYAFIPFTKGQKFCIGSRYAILFLKTALAKLIKAYKFTTDFKYKYIVPENHMTLKLVQGPQIRIEKRITPE